MKPLVLSCLFSLAFFVSLSIQAQSLASAQTQLKQSEDQLESLNQEDQGINTRLAILNSKIARLRQNQSDNPKLLSAETYLKEAQNKFQKKPSKISQDKLEMAEFKYALALRKHSKNTPALQALLTEQDELNNLHTLNNAKIIDLNNKIPQQVQRINALRQNNQRAAINTQRETSQKNASENFQRVEKERLAALAEIKKLKQQLAQQTQKSAQTTVKNQPSVTIAPAIKKPSNLLFFNTPAELTQHIETLTQQPDTLIKERFRKFLIIKALQNDGTTKTTPLKLRHSSHDIYSNHKVMLQQAKISLIVGQTQWDIDLQQLNPNRANVTGKYSVYLDARNTNQLVLLISPNESI